MGVDVQRGGRLTVAQEARYGGYVGPAGDQEAGVGVPQGVDVQSGGRPCFFRISLNRQVKVEGVMGSRPP